jgi:hypothetical protein
VRFCIGEVRQAGDQGAVSPIGAQALKPSDRVCNVGSFSSLQRPPDVFGISVSREPCAHIS